MTIKCFKFKPTKWNQNFKTESIKGSKFDQESLIFYYLECKKKGFKKKGGPKASYNVQAPFLITYEQTLAGL